nr:FAD-dependent oxidoreductase [Nocardia abscessus]
MSRTSVDPILIIGAGPTGLTLAYELQRRGVPCRVIDKRRGPATTSRSFTVHIRTLEGYDRAGIVPRLLELGIWSGGMVSHFRGEEERERLDFEQLSMRFPGILLLEQDRLEGVLRDELASFAVLVEWDTELCSLTTDDDGHITGTVIHRDPDGREIVETVRPSWLVGCDGVRSTVRTLLGSGFDGSEYTGSMRMMDVPVYGLPPGDTDIRYDIHEDDMLLTVQLPKNYRVLISDTRPVERTKPDLEVAREEFQRVVDKHFGGGVRLGDPEWSTVFEIWRRMSTDYRVGNIFLCGDAAHVHSPAGGQGMNAAIQDAFNLGYKLAHVAAGVAPESLLDTYELERRPIAKQVIDGTHMLHSFMMAHGDSIASRRAIVRAPGFKQKAAAQIAGVSYNYRDDIAAPPVLAPLDGLRAGDRAPDVAITPTLWLHDQLRHTGYTLLILQREPSTLAASVARTVQPYGERVRVVVITCPAVAAAAPPCAVIAESDEVFDLYGTSTTDTLCVVRPDGYVGLRCHADDESALRAMLESVLSVPRTSEEVDTSAPLVAHGADGN